MLFAAGPCTIKPRNDCWKSIKEPIRSHSDIDKDNAKHFKKATKLYENIAAKAVKNCHTVDIFAWLLRSNWYVGNEEFM